MIMIVIIIIIIIITIIIFQQVRMSCQKNQDLTAPRSSRCSFSKVLQAGERTLMNE